MSEMVLSLVYNGFHQNTMSSLYNDTGYHRFVHSLQDEYAQSVVSHFKSQTTMVSFVAPPQWGKTGMFTSVIGKMVDSEMAEFDNVFVITGLSQSDWQNQTRNRLREAFTHIKYKANLFQDANVMKLAELCTTKAFNNLKNALIIIDECHIASTDKQTIAKAFAEIPLDDVVEMRKRKIFILNVSATPDNVLYQSSEKWPTLGHQAIIATNVAESYTGFGKLFDEERVFQALSAKRNEAEFRELFTIGIPNRFRTPKWHIFRLPHKYDDCVLLKDLIPLDIYKVVTHDMLNKMDLEQLSQAPKRHTIILIKRMWGCAQTLDDTHVGLVHDTYYRNAANYSAVAQGLAGRLCGHNRSSDTIVYCDVKALKEYQKLFDNGFDYSNIDKYNALNFKIRNGVATASTSYSARSDDSDSEDTPPPPRAKDTYRIFASQEEAITWSKANLDHTFRKRKDANAPKELLENGENPTVDYIIKRWWGLSAKTKYRMVPATDGQWVVYWKPGDEEVNLNELD